MVSVDRAAATARLANTGASQGTLDEADGIAVSQIGQLAARHRSMTPHDEATVFAMRRLWLQPNLANTLAVGTFTLPGADVDTFIEAIDQRADQIINPEDPQRPRLEQRRLDALLSLALDATVPLPDSQGPAPRRLKANIFIDANESSRTNGQTGAQPAPGSK
jgi:hypothetical protein